MATAVKQEQRRPGPARGQGQNSTGDLPRIVIVGAGFGGLQAARALRTTPVQVTVIDLSNHHVFQPLLHEVATAALPPLISLPPFAVSCRNNAMPR